MLKKRINTVATIAQMQAETSVSLNRQMAAIMVG
jgi:hypothetical protein